ncbi:LCP family protein [Mycolicibacterium sp. CBMA 295]|uniref:LCP family protein n=1 Tax=Mycolicibacterium sp. CBMA 295 TaxID=2606605 RepID=UPI00281540D8|nr:LCP family protein [Mycolicibacterium sp. CBMA 295]
MLAAGRVLAALIAVVVLVGTGMGWGSYRNVTAGITTSQALVGGPASSDGDQNILIMGLDSRLDQHGQPLPADIYDALHAGDETVGGYNANVLIVLHIPGGDGPITAISIPRDDYVELAGCPTADCKGKVKQAYGLAYQHALDTAAANNETGSATASTAAPDPVVAEQMGREAGRKAEIDTVRRLLGIPIDHFVEVTLVAFFQIANVVQPITVCVNADTADPYSGANFHQGVQQIDGPQAMAFVRQRRDVNDEMFTDMDRTRRQQAFIASLVSALRHGGALSSPTALRHLLDVARQNVAVDSGFDLARFAQHASGFTDRALSLYTLPITEFGQDSAGEDVNLIDLPTIRDIAHNLTTGGSPTSSSPASNTPAVPAVLNVVNATTHNGLASSLVDTFASRGFSPGQATTADTLAQVSSIDYGPGANDAAHTLADQFGLTATASDAIGPNTVQLTLGADFPAGDYLTNTSTDSATALAATPTERHRHPLREMTGLSYSAASGRVDRRRSGLSFAPAANMRRAVRYPLLSQTSQTAHQTRAQHKHHLPAGPIPPIRSYRLA